MYSCRPPTHTYAYSRSPLRTKESDAFSVLCTYGCSIVAKSAVDTSIACFSVSKFTTVVAKSSEEYAVNLARDSFCTDKMTEVRMY